MQRRSGIIALSLFIFAAVPRLAFAHAGHDHGEGGFGSGFMHPITGLDHLIAMVAIGVWAVQAGGRAVVLLPVVFVSLMLVGGGVVMSGVSVPLVEPGIVASVLVLGLIIATAARLPLLAGIIITAAFAFMHGAAHGQELGEASPMLFALGAVLASTLLHMAGALLGTMVHAKAGALPLRIAGGGVAVAGLLMMAGVL